MDDPVLRGRIITICIGLVFAGVVWWVISSGSSKVADTNSDEHRKIIEMGCEAGGHERGSETFQKCVVLATKQCGGGGGVARNLATCARAVASTDF